MTWTLLSEAGSGGGVLVGLATDLRGDALAGPSRPLPPFFVKNWSKADRGVVHLSRRVESVDTWRVAKGRCGRLGRGRPGGV